MISVLEKSFELELSSLHFPVAAMMKEADIDNDGKLSYDGACQLSVIVSVAFLHLNNVDHSAYLPEYFHVTTFKFNKRRSKPY